MTSCPDGHSVLASIAGWIVDILVGWIVGSILFGIAFAALGELFGAAEAMQWFGGVLGIVIGIAVMRRSRARRAAAR